MNKQIAENNKLIAEFMGHKVGITQDEYDDLNDKGIENVVYLFHEDNLPYHKEWDWLMVVIEKIKSLGYVTEISGNRERSFASIGIENTNEYVAKAGYDTEFLKQIDATYYAVIQFINWYNSNK